MQPIRLNPEHIRQLCEAADDAFYIMDPGTSAKATLEVDEFGVVIDFSRVFQISLRMSDGDTILIESPERTVLLPLEQVRFAVAQMAAEASRKVAEGLGLA